MNLYRPCCYSIDHEPEYANMGTQTNSGIVPKFKGLVISDVSPALTPRLMSQVLVSTTTSKASRNFTAAKQRWPDETVEMSSDCKFPCLNVNLMIIADSETDRYIAFPKIQSEDMMEKTENFTYVVDEFGSFYEDEPVVTHLDGPSELKTEKRQKTKHLDVRRQPDGRDMYKKIIKHVIKELASEFKTKRSSSSEFGQ